MLAYLSHAGNSYMTCEESPLAFFSNSHAVEWDKPLEW